MQTPRTDMADVIYNAAEQSFEATVRVHGTDGVSTYACTVAAPITTSFENAAKALAAQALHKHGAPSGLRSWTAEAPVTPLRATKLRRGLPLGMYGFFRGRAA